MRSRNTAEQNGDLREGDLQSKFLYVAPLIQDYKVTKKVCCLK